MGKSRRVSEVEKNFVLEVRPRSRTGKSVKLLTARPLEKHDSTHVIGEVLFRIVSDLQSKIKCHFWPILLHALVKFPNFFLSNQRIAHAQPTTCTPTIVTRLKRGHATKA